MKKAVNYLVPLLLVILAVLSCGCFDLEIPGVIEMAPTPQIVYVTVTVPVPVTVYVTPEPTSAIPTTTLTTATTVPTTIITTAPTTAPTTITTTPTQVANGTLHITTSAGATGTPFRVFIISAGVDTTNYPPLTYDEYGNGVINPGYKPIKIQADGSSEPVSLTPGNYVAYLPNKIRGQNPEIQSFIINADNLTTVQFYAYSYHNV